MRVLIRVLLALAILTFTVPAVAEISVIQDYCEQYVEGNDEVLIIHFSVVNFNLPFTFIRFEFVPEPLPVWPQCEVVETVAPDSWTGLLTPSGGARFNGYSATSEIEPGEMLSGFQIVVGNPNFCCYVVQFTGTNGEVMWEQEECFNCALVDDEDLSWGSIKSLY